MPLAGPPHPGTHPPHPSHDFMLGHCMRQKKGEEGEKRRETGKGRQEMEEEKLEKEGRKR